MSQITKTSLSHPLQIAEVHAPGGGVLGITFCPGKNQLSAFSGAWARDLHLDLNAIQRWGASLVLTLVTEGEMIDLMVPMLGTETRARAMRWLQTPIPDTMTPDARWEDVWREERISLHRILDGGGKVLVHCKGGLGRAGTIAARILIERGDTAEQAMTKVRKVRPGAVENNRQEMYLHDFEAAALGNSNLRWPLA